MFSSFPWFCPAVRTRTPLPATAAAATAGLTEPGEKTREPRSWDRPPKLQGNLPCIFPAASKTADRR
ncbi:hypothetical protein AALO_G00099320 [Alosa alosa]|uniref:Secreted protein n=1 Tax=Alosa alosa TaxID=278164 RepID=A0AAV6GTL2_9TELE|nr:hypothetical protein AALO_G00099320 [Alosa alosa]